MFSIYFSNWGTETDNDFSYHNGNTDPRGFGECNLVSQHYLCW